MDVFKCIRVIGCKFASDLTPYVVAEANNDW